MLADKGGNGVLRAHIARRIRASPIARRVWESRTAERVRSARPTAPWQVTASATKAARRLGLSYRKTSAALGRAAMRAGDHQTAIEAFTAAITGPDSSETWHDVVASVQGIDRSVEVPTVWLARLGECLHRTNEYDDAAVLVRAASASAPSNMAWLETLADIEEARGDLDSEAQALERLFVLRATSSPRVGTRLARVYARAGQWARAEQILTANIERHPLFAGSYKDLADVAGAMRTWGGSFTGTLPDRLAGSFSFGVNASTTAAGALSQAVKLQPARPAWRAAFAAARADEGDLQSAIAMYEDVVTEAETSNAQWALGAKQKWQFGLEMTRHRTGAPRVDDPLFACDFTPEGAPATGETPVAGFFRVKAADNGLSVTGILAQNDSAQLDIVINGHVLRSLTPSASFLPTFALTIKRNSVAKFPRAGTLEMRTRDGAQLRTVGGTERLEFTVPHGDGSLPEILGTGVTLDKKGEIRASHAEAQLRHDQDLNIYAHARDFFDVKRGRPLFLLYGTLLGCFRDGDFIPGDDDFDVGYVSEETTPEAVKEEAKNIVVELVRAGFTVSFNRRGRLFRIHLDEGAGSDRHIDVQFVWLQDGKAWAHNQACLPASRADFVPITEGKLRGTKVYLPNDPEVFLRANYGPQWKTPDPGFRYYPADIDRSVRNNLAKSLMTVSEYKDLAKRVTSEVADRPGAGRLVSLGSQDLYPLDKFIS